MRSTEEVKKILWSIFFGICMMMTIVSLLITIISINNWTIWYDNEKIQESRYNPIRAFGVSTEVAEPKKDLNDNLRDVPE